MTSLPIHSVTSISQTFPSIRRTVFYVEETLLAIHIIAGFLNGLIHGTRYTSVQEIVLLYAVLGILVWLGFSFPNESPAWQKRAYIWLEIFCLMLTCIFTNSDLDLLLYLVLAKSCFLLNRREVILTAIATGIAWQICKVWDLADRIRIIRSTIAGYLSDPDGITISLIINNALGYLAASTFVIVLCRVILAERKSRQEAIALAQEIEILAATLERTRIARNIHDSLGHTLTSLDVQLELALRLSSQDSARSLQALNTAKNLASQALQEVRRAVSTIREKDFDLKEALGSLLQKFQQNQSFKVKKKFNLPKLPLQTSHQLYCIVQEGLTNIQRHSQASEVGLYAQTTPTTIVLEIIDDGVGFDCQALISGFGLRGMQERVQMLGGQIQIASTPGLGTRIQVKIPYQE